MKGREALREACGDKVTLKKLKLLPFNNEVGHKSGNKE